MVSYEAQFAIGERVIIDGDSSLVGTVTACVLPGAGCADRGLLGH